MPSYPKLKLVEHIPANLVSFLMTEEGEEDSMFQVPFTLKISGQDEAFVILVCEHDDDGFYGFTMLYYQRWGDRWHRWLLERPDLPKDQRWEPADAPFTGLEYAIGYEERARRIQQRLNDEDMETVRSNSPFNGTGVLPFGKYAGCTVRSILDKGDLGYIRWAWDNKMELREYIISNADINSNENTSGTAE